MNAGAWAQLERQVRQLALKADAVYIVTGLIFDTRPETIGPNQVAVPSAFFKVILLVRNGQASTFASVVPNHPTSRPLATFSTTIAHAERLSHLHFFPKLHNLPLTLLTANRRE